MDGDGVGEVGRLGEGYGAVAVYGEGRLVGGAEDVVPGDLLVLCGSWGVMRVRWVLEEGKGRCWLGLGFGAWRCGLLGLLMVLSLCLLDDFLCLVIYSPRIDVVSGGTHCLPFLIFLLPRIRGALLLWPRVWTSTRFTIVALKVRATIFNSALRRSVL